MKHKTKRYYQGGTATASTSIPVPEEGTGLQKETRDEAFARARRNKQKTFEYDGKTFTTEYKEEKAAREAKEKAKEDAEERRNSAIGDKYLADKAKPAPKARARISSEDVAPPPGTKLSYEDSRAYPRESRAAVKGASAVRSEPSTARVSNPSIRGGGGGGGSSAASRKLQLGSELDPKELMRSNSLRGRDKARFNDDDAEFKKGGKVKKYAAGGSVTPTPAPTPKKKDTMPEWAKNERENQKRDELNKREAEGAAKEVKRNMSTFGFKNGGSASSRGDGCAMRGKTRGKMY